MEKLMYCPVDKTLQSMTGISKVGQTAVSVTGSIQKLMGLIQGAVDAMGVVEEPDAIASLVSGFKQIGDVIQTFKIVQQLPKLTQSLGRDSQEIVQFLHSFEKSSEDVISQVSEILEGNWEGNPLEFTTDSTGKVREGLAQIQGLIRNGVEAPLGKLSDSFSQLKQQISSLSFIGKPLSFHTGVASYQRKSVISMDMPCVEPGQLKFKPCPISVAISWPNHHIPWVRIG